MTATPLRSLAFVVNASKDGAEGLAGALSALCRERGITVRATTEYPLPDGFLQGADACCVFGGDGTLLATVPQATRYRVPVFGVNRGKLGFLVTIGFDEAEAQFLAMLEGRYVREERSVLQCHTPDGRHGLALNDIVIKHRTMAPIIGLKVNHDGDPVSRFYSDGIIFSTPTGSTAYNLSAGGPIIHPSARVVAMTPICPHTLTNRSIIFPHAARLTIECADQNPMPTVTVDGHMHIAGDDTFPLEISSLEQPMIILQPPGYSHFHVLRNKLNWGVMNESF